jgi:CBS domain-containing protein
LAGIVSERDFLRKAPLNKKIFSLKVKDIMTPNVVTVEPTLSLPEGARLMKEKGFRRLVVASEGKILGLVTQTDFSRKIDSVFSSFPASKKFLIDKIMQKPVLTEQKETFAKAREKMKKADIGGAIIVNNIRNPKEIQGFFSEYDVVMQFYDQQGDLHLKEVSSFTRKYVRAISFDTNIFEANKLLLQKKIHRLPVMKGEKLVGIITQREVIRFVYLHLHDCLQEIEKKETPLVSLAKNHEFCGEFVGDTLKIYPTTCSLENHS